MNIDYSLDDLNAVARKIIDYTPYKTLLFYGNMAVGKTTLIKEICKVLGVNYHTNSPTFSIVNEYENSSNQKIYHFDFYRINDEDEAYDIGIEDYLYDNQWCLIEWPEKIANLIPQDSVSIHITELDDGRRNLTIQKTN